MNEINAIKIECKSGYWCFTDESVGLKDEGLVGGMPEIIGAACNDFGIKNPEKGFLCIFSKNPFRGSQFSLKWKGPEGGGNIYRYSQNKKAIDGYLCPALFHYFDINQGPPQNIFVEVRPVQ